MRLYPRPAGAATVMALLALAVATPLAGRQSPSAASTLVVLVRHAERAAVEGDDPPLSDAGQARARALAASLAHASVSAVITSSRRRTGETAQPLLSQRGLTPTVVSVADGLAKQVADVAAAVRRHAGGVVLVVGHSNTIPAIVGALGGPALPDLCDGEFATMFVMQLGGERRPQIIRTTYGAADPPGAADCVMTPRP